MGARPEPMFPILGDPVIKAIPWAVITPHEAQAQRNHGQSLRRLAQRGGLGVIEAFLIIEDRDWKGLNPPFAEQKLAAYRMELMRQVWKFEKSRATPLSPVEQGEQP